jgi:hypothetical protein
MDQSFPAEVTHTAEPAGLRVALGLIVALSACAAHPVLAANLSCPPRMPGPHPGFEQVGPVPAAHWLLRRVRLFNTARSTDATKEMPPKQTVENSDGFTSTWHFAGDESLLMLCLYNGSGTYYVARPNPPPTLCVTHDNNGLTQAWCEEP